MDAELREFVAQHEAGHAVTMIVLGWSVRYVTLRPHGSDAGRTWGRPPRRHDLLEAGAVFLAGMAAESSLVDDRRFLIHGGRGDLQGARNVARRIVHLRELTGDLQGIDASWSEWDLGARMWHRARDLVTEHEASINWVAAKLLSSRQAVSGSWVRDAIRYSPRRDEPPEPDEWWLPNYSRLAWRR